MKERLSPFRILHTMLRVGDLERSLEFYLRLGMRILRRQEYPKGRFTLVFLGYGTEQETTVVELTHNWDESAYQLGNGFGHLALQVEDIYLTCHHLESIGVSILRRPGPMKFDQGECIAFVQDPDGYKIELIER